VDHIRKNHGDSKAEASRGQVAVTAQDLARVPEMVTSYDAINANVSVKNEQGNQMLRGLVFAKKFEDGVLVYTGVVSRKRQDVRGATMWKYPPTIDAQTAIERATANLTSETLGGMSGTLPDQGGSYNQGADRPATPEFEHGSATAGVGRRGASRWWCTTALPPTSMRSIWARTSAAWAVLGSATATTTPMTWRGAGMGA
jgi:hypothetical protein